MKYSPGKWFLNRTLKQKLNILLGLTVVVMTAISLIGMDRIKSIYSEYLYSTIADQLAYSGQTLSDNLQTVEELGRLIQQNKTVQEKMSLIKESKDIQERVTANIELNTILSGYYKAFLGNNIRYITLCCNSYSSTNNIYAASKIPYTVKINLRSIAAVKSGKPQWVSDYNEDYGMFYCKEIRTLNQLSPRPLGELLICFDIEKAITAATLSNENYNLDGYLLYDGETPLYHSDLDITTEEMRSLHSEMTESYKIIRLQNHRYFAVRLPIPNSRWNSICLISYDAISDRQFHAYALVITIQLLVTLLLLSFIYRQIIGITNDYDVLKQKMHLAASDPSASIQPICDYNQRHDEIAILHQQFDQMLQQFNELIQENYINELQKKEAQLQALQSQINPHFLYNTLESVNWRARALGAKDISEMVQALASLLRVTLNQGQPNLSIKQECDLLENYMKIQQYRFEDRLNCTIRLSDAISHVQIPCLCIQPLAENAIHYGLENNIDDCEIVIEGYEENGLVHLIVRNTGSEFEDDLLQRIREQEFTPKRHGIALKNIDERIHLTYGREYGLHLYNRDEWAVAEIIIPFAKEPLITNKEV